MVGTFGPVDISIQKSHPQACGPGHRPVTATVLLPTPPCRCSRDHPTDAGDSLALGQLADAGRSVAVAGIGLLGLGQLD